MEQLILQYSATAETFVMHLTFTITTLVFCIKIACGEIQKARFEMKRKQHTRRGESK